ncbi:MAG: precorrin-6Y C5,15-methyltransferase (decarboxylating) subunit CbiT, partial [Gemmataceae bacterium]
GSGAVAIEAAQLSEPGMVYAIERDAADYQLILANAEKFGVKNLKAIHGAAPGVFTGLPAPDAVFIGGAGREIGSVLGPAWEALRPSGRLVVHLASIDNLTIAYGILRKSAGHVDAMLVQMSRGVEQLESLRFEAINPSFLLTVSK